MQKRPGLFIVLLVALVAMLPQVANASTILNPAQNGAPALDNSTNLGVELASTTVTLSPLSQTFGGTESEEVWQQASGMLVFAYQFNVTAGVGASDPIVRATMNPFTGYMVGTAYRTVALGTLTASSTYTPASSDRNAAGDTVAFDTIGPGGLGVPAGQSSAILLIFTNATQYTRTAFMSVSDGGTATNFAEGPTGAAVPETGTMTLIGGGLIGIAVLTRRRLVS